ncbi:hypothetical protein ABFS83_01G073400 [Erythranthe nasuta]
MASLATVFCILFALFFASVSYMGEQAKAEEINYKTNGIIKIDKSSCLSNYGICHDEPACIAKCNQIWIHRSPRGYCDHDPGYPDLCLCLHDCP